MQASAASPHTPTPPPFPQEKEEKQQLLRPELYTASNQNATISSSHTLNGNRA